MEPRFEDLISDVSKLFDGKDFLGSSIEIFGNNLGGLVADQFERYLEERQPKLYLSNVGKPLRQLWYDLKGFKGEPLSAETKLKFIYGNLIEELFIFLAKEAGHKVEFLQERVEYEGVSGKIDAIIDDVLIDVKSCSTQSFRKFEVGSLLHDDPFGYIAQLTGYAKATNSKRAAFIAIDKVLGKICTFELTQEVMNGYDLSGRIKEVRRAIESSSEPNRCYEPKPVSKQDRSGNLVLGSGCSYCSHKQYCWRDANEGKGLLLRHYSNGPRWFTRLVKEPRLNNSYNETSTDQFPIKEEDN